MLSQKLTPACAPVKAPFSSRAQRLVVQASARPQEIKPKAALFGTAAAALLLASPVGAAEVQHHLVKAQEVVEIAAVNDENNMKIDPKSSTDPLGTPGSQSRYPEGQPLSGDEAKVREARRLLIAEEQSDAARKPGQEYTKTNTFLDPYGRKESAGDAASKFK